LAQPIFINVHLVVVENFNNPVLGQIETVLKPIFSLSLSLFLPSTVLAEPQGQIKATSRHGELLYKGEEESTYLHSRVRG